MASKNGISINPNQIENKVTPLKVEGGLEPNSTSEIEIFNGDFSFKIILPKNKTVEIVIE